MTADGQPTPSAGRFDEAMAVSRLGDGRHGVQIDAAWGGPFGANGGCLAALLVRAVETEPAVAGLAPRVVNVSYLTATVAGPAQITTVTLGRTARTATLRADLNQAGRLTASALITCSQTNGQQLEMARRMPDAPSPQQLTELAPGALADGPACLARLRMWPCFGSVPFSGGDRAVTGGWLALRDDDPDQPIGADRLAAFTDLWWPAVFSVTQAPIGVPTLSLTIQLRCSEPVTGPVLARYETTTVAEGHLDEIGELWSADGRLLAESRQLVRLMSTWRPQPAAAG